MKNRKSLALLLVLLMLTTLIFSACGNTETPSTSKPSAPSTEAPSDTPKADESGIKEYSDLDLPSYISFSTYDVGSATFSQVAGLCEGILTKTGLTTRQIVASTDMARLLPVRSGSINVCVGTSNMTELASKGAAPYNTTDWGPQSFRQVWSCPAAAGIGVYVLEDSDIQSIADLAGKRVTYIPGNDSANLAGGAVLAYAGLTWDDVEMCICSGPSDSYNAFAEGRADCYIGGSTSANLVEISQTKGVRLISPDPDNTEAWNRVKSFASAFYCDKSVKAVGTSEDNPGYVFGFVAPVFLTYADTCTFDLAYALAKAIDESYEEYKDYDVNLVNYAVKTALVPEALVIPVHEGALQYFKDMGYWTDELQARQDFLLTKEAAYAQAWDEALGYASENVISGEAFSEYWTAVSANVEY